MSRKRKQRKTHALQFAASAIGKSFRLVGETCQFEEIAAEAQGATKLKRFSMTAYTGGAMNVGFGLPLVVDLEGMNIRAQSVPILRSHDPGMIAGHSEKIEVTAQRVYVTGVLSGVGAAVDEIKATSANGFPWQASIGATIDKSPDFVDRGESVKVNGKNFDGPLFVARKTTLAEVSFVPVGADMNTSANVAAAFQGEIDMDFAAWLKAKNIDVAKLDEPTKTALQAAFDAEQGDDPPAPSPKPTPAAKPGADINAAEAANITRVASIKKLCAGQMDTEIEIDDPEKAGQKKKVVLCAHAIEANWTPAETELQLLRASRPAPSVISHGHDKDCTLEVLQAAMVLRFGGRLDHPSYQTPEAVASRVSPWLRAGINDANRNRIMEAAHRFSHLSAIDVAREACRLSGRQVPHDRHAMLEAAFSGGALTSIFTDSVNARLLATYQEAGDTTSGWCQEADVPDFKQQKDIRLTKGTGLGRLPRGGTADHESRSDTYETYAIARYAKQVVVDEQDFIDDMLQAIADFPVEMGNEAARLRPDLVYAIILANPTLTATGRELFNSTDDNIDTGSALASGTLKVGIANMNVKRENGVNLNLNPTHLIVPSTLRFLGKELISSSQLLLAGTSGAITERGSNNVLADENFMLVSDARLENGVTNPATGTAYGGSASTWYLACAKARTIVVAYLRGTGRVPQVRSFTLDKGQWGMGWDIKHDVGAAARDFRGLYKATA